MRAAITRPAVSEELPAAKGTTMVSGRVGQASWAADGRAAAIPKAAVRRAMAVRERCSMGDLRSRAVECYPGGDPDESKVRALGVAGQLCWFGTSGMIRR